MKVSKVDVFPTRLPFKSDFKIARGSVGNPDVGAPHVFVQITADDGVVGWGEARPSHRWSYETEESVVNTIRNYLAPALIGHDIADVDGIHRLMDVEIAPGMTHGQPIAKCAIDIALHDLRAHAYGVNVQSLFGSSQHADVKLTWIVSDQTPEGAARMASEAVSKGYRGVKVKIGFSPERDADILRAVKETAPDVYLWADANQAYCVADARRVIRTASDLGANLIEQLLPANDLDGHRRLIKYSDVPIALDESVWSPRDLINAIRAEAVDTLVVKLSKMAGFHRARQCIEIAQAAGIGVIGSGLTESPLGFMASIQLYSAFGVEYADLNGPGQFLGDGPGWDAVKIEHGIIHAPDAPGIGIELDDAEVRRFERK
jgi:muconate cycloisomerase